ncbi:MAG: phosphatidate cytidylyltransferase [Chloroflexota bacterium]|nr:phosphatidate cytidylyltransferase [Chloroflexota bacterium]
MLRTRILSAVILIPIVGTAVYLGGPWLAAVVGLAALVAGWEFYGLLRKGGYEPSTSLGLLLIALLLLGFYRPRWGLIQPTVAGMVILILGWQLFRADSSAPMVDWALTLSGGLYLGLLMGYFLLLRAAPQGLRWIAVALLSTWICDGMAYFVGLSRGRHKIWPRISPKKSWEGAVGGWMGGVVLTPVIAGLLGLGWSHGALIGALVGIVAPFGDFAVSMLKRQVGAKDSSRLIPGHGGMLDRLDSLLFTVPVVYYYVRFVVGL